MTDYIDQHRDVHGVEPICRTLEIAPSTYYARRSRPPSTRAVRDEARKIEIARVFDENYRVYGQHKVWKQLRREGTDIGRDQVARLMRDLEICGVRRAKKRRTTIPCRFSA
jgi:putative transposase